MNNRPKETVLLIGRGQRFADYIQGMIDGFSENYNVLVLELQAGIKYTGKYTAVYLPKVTTSPASSFWNNLKNAEKDIDVNLFSSYANYFYYGRLAEEANIDYSSYWKSKEWIGEQFLQAYDFMSSLINDYDIKFVFHDTIDMILTQVVEAFSLKYNFGFYHTLICIGLFDNRVLLTCGGSRKSPLYTQYIDEKIVPTDEELAQVNQLIAEFEIRKKIPEYLQNSSQKLLSWKEICKLPSNLKNTPYALKRVLNRFYMRKITKDFSHEKVGKYLLYFLQHQPEATITSAAPKYVDQWKIIEDVAVNAPSDMTIVVKDHPFSFGWKGKKYFDKLKRLPNVEIAPVSYPGKELIKNSQAVITINGSIGVEAFLYGIPVFSLGDPWYSHPSYIKNIESPVDFLNEWNKLHHISNDDKILIITAMLRSTFIYMHPRATISRDQKIESGVNLAKHVLAHSDIYFFRGKN